MDAVFPDPLIPLAVRASGIRVLHYADLTNGSLAEHEGDIEKCPAPECRWPRLREMLTVTSGGRRVTGGLILKEGNAVEVKTADGTVHRAPRVTAMRPEWGVYCPHGTKIIEAEPAEHNCEEPWPPCDKRGELGHLCGDHHWCHACYPTGRKILPWACEEEGCSEAAFDREQQEMEEQYWEEMNRSLYG